MIQKDFSIKNFFIFVIFPILSISTFFLISKLDIFYYGKVVALITNFILIFISAVGIFFIEQYLIPRFKYRKIKFFKNDINIYLTSIVISIFFLIIIFELIYFLEYKKVDFYSIRAFKHVEIKLGENFQKNFTEIKNNIYVVLSIINIYINIFIKAGLFCLIKIFINFCGDKNYN